MTLEHLTRELSQLNESELEAVAQYVSVLKRREQLPPFDEAQLTALYAETAEEDRELAEAVLPDDIQGLAREDAR